MKKKTLPTIVASTCLVMPKTWVRIRLLGRYLFELLKLMTANTFEVISVIHLWHLIDL